MLIDRVSDSKVYEDAIREIQSIVRASITPEYIKSQQPHQESTLIARKNSISKTADLKLDVARKKPEPGFLDLLGQALGISEQKGYCIRSGEAIAYDVRHPLCSKHYEAWKEYHDPDYKENFCHRCGERHRTSVNKPLCLSCFKKEQS